MATTISLSNLLSVSEIDVSYRPSLKVSERPTIQSSQEAYDVIRPFFEEDLYYRELMYVIFLARNNSVLGVRKISEGGTSGTVVDPKMIFGPALKANASSVILCHNHPSMNCKPSRADITITKKMKEAGAMLELPVLDHLIICDENYYSFADEGIL